MKRIYQTAFGERPSAFCRDFTLTRVTYEGYMTRVEGQNTRLRNYLARLHRKTLYYSKSVEMLKHSIRLLLHYLKFADVPVP
jgi:IS1 family transposase